MAPEILRGNKYEAASDVYSYGVILWELITGQIPYLHRSLAQITGLVGYYGKKLPTPKTKLCQSGVLQKLAKNCLIFEPNRRPNFEQIINYLDKYEFKIHSRNHDEFMENLAEFIT
jgi:serine/threonine protein kinase